jgi:hypothetical protein
LDAEFCHQVSIGVSPRAEAPSRFLAFFRFGPSFLRRSSFSRSALAVVVPILSLAVSVLSFAMLRHACIITFPDQRLSSGRGPSGTSACNELLAAWPDGA